MREATASLDPLRWDPATVAHVGHDDPLGVGVSTPAVTAAVLGLVIAGTTVQLRVYRSLPRRWVAVGFVAAAAFLLFAGLLTLQHLGA